MAIVAEFTIPPDALPGGAVLEEMSDVRVEIERVVPTQQSALPYLWVWGSDPELFLEQAERKSDITSVELLERVEEGALCRAKWSPNAELIRGIKRLNATIIEATATADHWRFEVRAQDQDAFIEFQEVFENQGIHVRLERLYRLDDLVDDGVRTVTPTQRETLVAAYQQGYFETPRQATQEDLGEHFGITHRAVSERLRRGVRNLVAATLLPSGKRT